MNNLNKTNRSKFTSYTTSTQMTVHRIAFYELSSNELFFLGGGYNFIKLVRLGLVRLG